MFGDVIMFGCDVIKFGCDVIILCCQGGIGIPGIIGGMPGTSPLGGMPIG